MVCFQLYCAKTRTKDFSFCWKIEILRNCLTKKSCLSKELLNVSIIMPL